MAAPTTHDVQLDTLGALARIAQRALSERRHGKCRRALLAMRAVSRETSGCPLMLDAFRGLLDECIEALDLGRPDWASPVDDLPALVRHLHPD